MMIAKRTTALMLAMTVVTLGTPAAFAQFDPTQIAQNQDNDNVDQTNVSVIKQEAKNTAKASNEVEKSVVFGDTEVEAEAESEQEAEVEQENVNIDNDEQEISQNLCQLQAISLLCGGDVEVEADLGIDIGTLLDEMNA
jgi:hypothetical protein